MTGRKRQDVQGKMDPRVTRPWPVPYGGDFGIWEGIAATFDFPGRPIIELDLVVEDGEPVIERLELRRRPDEAGITASDLRTFTLRHLVNQLVGKYVMRRTDHGDRFELTPIWRGDADRPKLEAALRRRFAQETRKGRPRIDDDTAERVLRLWGESAGRRRRADWVAERAGVSRTKVYEIVKDGSQ
jgi:hypothetical protein